MRLSLEGTGVTFPGREYWGEERVLRGEGGGGG